MNEREADNPQRLYQTGLDCLFGRGQPKRDKLAEYYFDRAMLRGHPEATYYLGLLYLTGGKGVTQDTDEGIGLLECAKLNPVGVAANARLVLEKRTPEEQIAEAGRLLNEGAPQQE